MTTKTELTPTYILCTKATLALHRSTSDNAVLKFAISQAADMLEYLAEILSESKPVAEVIAGKNGEFNGQIFSDKQWVDLVNLPVGTKLYTNPQPDNRDARIAELENEVAECKRTIAEYELKERNVLASRGIV